MADEAAEAPPAEGAAAPAESEVPAAEGGSDEAPAAEGEGGEAEGGAPDGGGSGEATEEEKAQAALKIQTRQRGARDRKKVAEAKEAGELPGQKRGAPAGEGGEGAAGAAGGGGEGEAADEGGGEARAAQGGEATEEEKAQAALKIQTRQRGARDRKKVAEAKEAGALPGQNRGAAAEGGGGGEGGGDAAAAAAEGGEAEAAPAGDGEGGEAPGDEGDGEADMDEKSKAALKIQSRQRGVRDRKKVEQAKERGDLPGQKRAVPGDGDGGLSAPKELVPIDETVGEITFYDGIGSSYKGELANGRPHGKGVYTFANGNVYQGGFDQGQFQGEGELIFPGYGKFKASYDKGRAIGGDFFFEDGLQYRPQGWKYCVEGDRRFYHEVVDPRFGLSDE